MIVKRAYASVEYSARRPAWDVAFHYAGKGVGSLIALGFIPLFVHLLGAERYGVIGLYLILQSVVGLLDVGLSPTITREMSIHSGGRQGSDELRAVLRTFELASAAISLLIFLAIAAFAPAIAGHWSAGGENNLHLNEPLGLIVVVMGVSVAMRFFESLYRGALLGLQRHGAINIVAVTSSIGRWGGGFFLLWVSDLSLTTFFIWQALTSLTVILINARLAYSELSPTVKPVIPSFDYLRRRKAFLGGIAAAGILATIALELDKLMASSALSLSEFSYYSIAWSAAAGILMLANPLHAVSFPRLTRLYRAGQREQLLAAYISANDFLVFIIAPVATAIAVHSEVVLRLWGQPASVVSASHGYLSIFVLGILMNAYSIIPRAFQAATGTTRVLVIASLVAVACVGIGASFALFVFGSARMAAAAYLISQCFYALIIPPLLDRLHQTTLAMRILVRAALMSLAVSCCAALLVGKASATVVGSGTLTDLISVFGSMLIGWLLLAVLTPAPRQWIVQQLPKVYI